METIEYITKHKLVEDIVRNIGVKNTLSGDLVQEVYIILMEYNQDKLKELLETNSINYFITRICINQYYSKTSPFYKMYRKFSQNCEDENITTETADAYDQNTDNE